MKQIESFEKKDKHFTKVSNLFDFVHEERLACTGCSGVRYRPTTTSMLSLVIPAEKLTTGEGYKETTLEACLESLTSAETVESKCPACDANSATKYRLTFYLIASNIAEKKYH